MLPKIFRVPTSPPASAFGTTAAGFDISQTLIGYSANASTFGRGVLGRLLNTLVVAALGIIFATVIGFLIGLGRLSSNWLVGRLCGGYVEVIHNIRSCCNLLFWYNAVLKTLPDLRGSLELPGGAILIIAACSCRAWILAFRSSPRSSQYSLRSSQQWRCDLGAPAL